jgi:hypothetical protein
MSGNSSRCNQAKNATRLRQAQTIEDTRRSLSSIVLVCPRRQGVWRKVMQPG